MTLRDSFADAFKNLSANKLRSGLTMLGIIIGVAAVISMTSIVEGGQRKLVQSIERLGTNLLFIFHTSLTPEEQRKFAGRSTGQKYGDALAIRRLRPELLVAPILQFKKQLRAGDRDYSGQVTGTVPEYQEVRNFRPAVGRFLVQEDIDEWRRVVVLGRDIAEKLFGTGSALHREVKIGDERFIVVGVMEPKGSLHGTNYDELIFVPVTTTIRRFTGSDHVNFMLVHVPSRDEMEAVTRDIHSLLIQRHDGVDDIRIRNQGEFLKAIDRTLWTFRIVLGGVALVALLVGGIGIMNIMLVTVTERTSEIGLRKAIGAGRSHILRQFLIESVSISVVGGLIGILVGIGMAYGFGDLVARAMPGEGDWGAVVLPSAVLASFVFAVLVGITFGLYPAIKASKLDPAEALRYQ
ncbi:ABC transporter permease [Nitrospiraceae bacterium AH_259_D15_M11_P09]|nr:ABC transporter permease [Nitrospiraceae bacterium AH_259_D15_M11_P09]